MSSTKTVKDSTAYLSLLEKCGLLTEEQLADARQLARQESDPKTFARQLVKRELLTSWQATQLLGGFHELTIGKYKLCSQLGKSGIGRIYLAEHTQMVRQVAIKTLSRRHTSQPKVVAQFLADARAAAKLDHRNIVHVYDVDSADDRYFLVMEYLDGRDLQRAVDEDGPLTPDKTALAVRQAARGLAHAHSRELLHGDLNPADLIVDDQGVVKILALGLGRLSGAHRDDLDAGGHSDSYFAPEDRASKGTLNVAGDIYALGAVMYFLLVGKPPSPEFGARDLLRQRRELPESLARICARMMASDPAKRYSALTEVEQALDEWIAENVVEQPPAEIEAADEPVTFDWSPDKPAASVAPVVAPRLPRAQPAEDKTPAQPAATPAATALPKLKTAKAPGATLRRANVKTTGKSSQAKDPKSASAASAQPGQADDGDLAVADGTTAGLAATRSKKKPTSAARPAVPLGLLIGGGAGALAVVALVSVLLFMLLGNRGGTPVAATGPVDQAAAADDLETGAPKADSLESDGPDPLETDPPDPLEAPATTAGPSGGSQAAAETAAPSVSPMAELGAEATPQQPAADAPPASGAAPVPGETPEKPAQENSAPQKPATAEPAAGDSPPGEKPPADKPTPPAAPDPAKPTAPEAKPPAQPKTPVKPFAGFGKVVALPALGADNPTEPFVLGPVQVPEKLICFIKLRGGTNACKGSPEFVLRNAKSGTDERAWEVFLTGSKATEELKIADMTLQDNQLVFQWTADAASDPNADYLRNCALSMNVGPDVHEVALRTPVIIEPLVINLDKVADVYRIGVDSLPDPVAVRLQLVKSDGEVPPYLLEPESPILAIKGELRVKFGKLPEEQVLELDMEANTKRDIQVTVTPYFRWPLDEKPVKLTKATASKAERFALLARQQLVGELGQMREIEKKLAANEKPLAAQQISLKEQQLVKVEEGVQAVERLKGLYQAVSEKGRLHFRVFYDAEGIEVDLARSE